MPSYCDKDLKRANEIISFAFYSSVTTTKLDEMAPCFSNLRPILLPSTLILSFKRIWDPEDPQANHRPTGLVIAGFFLLASSPEGASSSPGWGHNQFNLHASETSPLNKIKCFPAPAWCSAQGSSSSFSLGAWMSSQPERRRQKEEVTC